ncbi:MAG: twin-arginine translocase subunit TatC [Anaerolineae bacterium]|nr:twin-arginine translocase subunit TatC [Anaerolineae bacterium]
MDDKQQTFLEHITELRTRLFRSVVALLIGAVIGSFFSSRVIAFLVSPVGLENVIVLSPTEAPVIYFKVALFVGLLLALPYILFQIYGFVGPGLYPNEERFFLLTVPGVLVLFALGATFTMTILIPFSLPVLMGFLQGIVMPTYSLEQYLSFVTTLLLWMGLLFQTPLVIYALARLGIVKPAFLKQIRKFVVFGAALLAAVITPTTDPVTMLLVTGPFIILYEIGIVLAGLAVKQKTGREAAA